MSGQNPTDPTGREADVNALLDGELDAAATESLKSAAAMDNRLAQAIVEAWQLQQGMDQLQLDKAPLSLRRRLKRIPREQKAAAGQSIFRPPHWAIAGSLASAMLLVVALLLDPAADEAPDSDSMQSAIAGQSDALRAEQTQRELEIAFFYLDKIGMRLGQEIQAVLKDEISAPVKDNISKYMPYTGQSQKEKHA